MKIKFMKITKEKIIYFLSLNIISILFIFLIFLYNCQLRVCPPDNHDIYLLEFLFFALPASLVAFIYNKVKKDKYNIFICSVLVLIPIYLLFSIIFVDILNSEKIFIIDFIIYFFKVWLFLYMFSLIVLKITDPLRRKIKW